MVMPVINRADYTKEDIINLLFNYLESTQLIKKDSFNEGYNQGYEDAKNKFYKEGFDEGVNKTKEFAKIIRGEKNG